MDAKTIAEASIARIRESDEAARRSAVAWEAGKFEEYWNAQLDAIMARIQEEYDELISEVAHADADSGPSSSGGD